MMPKIDHDLAYDKMASRMKEAAKEDENVTIDVNEKKSKNDEQESKEKQAFVFNY